MMIKYIKLQNTVHQNIEPFVVDEEGNEVWNIPNDFQELQQVAIDTFHWLIGYKVKQALGDELTKMSAWNSKAIVLLAKQVQSLNPTATLTTKEQSAFDSLIDLADNGYADSELLNNSFSILDSSFAKYTPLIEQANTATTVDELITLLS